MIILDITITINLEKLKNLDYELIVENNYIAKKYNNGILEISGQGLRYTTQPLGTTLYHTYPIKFTKIISLNVEFTRDITPDIQQFDINVLIGSATNPDGFATTDIKRTINAYYYTFYRVIGLWK